MATIKTAQTNAPILPVLADRWSPYSFAPRGVDEHLLTSCLEAARWAASSFNEQPWSFLLARREDAAEFPRILACLLEANQAWAKNAGVLLLTFVARKFTRNGQPNRVAEHDLGLAMGNLSCQATHFGLAVHQMAGIDLERVRATFAIPATHDPMTAVAIGYPDERDDPGNPFLARDRAPRTRKPLNEFVFRGSWGKPGLAIADPEKRGKS